MSATLDASVRPHWIDDQPDSPVAPDIRPPYFDDTLDVWVLSRYDDILAAFRSPDLIPTGAKNKPLTKLPDEAARLKMRAETREALSSEQLSVWQKHLATEANRRVKDLPIDRQVDLMGEFGLPCCLFFAAEATGIPQSDVEPLGKAAWAVSEAAGEPFNPALRSLADAGNAQLSGCFHAKAEMMRDSGFVALSHTFPAFLANAWLALLQNPQEWNHLHQHPGRLEKAMEELLRYAGLTRLLFRRAIGDVEINGANIKKGERVALRILAANKDPERFSHPTQMDVTRRNTSHLTLGAGLHSCVGASLVRMVAVTMTRPLIKRFAHAEITGTFEWRGGPVFRAPASLPVQLFETMA